MTTLRYATTVVHRKRLTNNCFAGAGPVPVRNPNGQTHRI